MRSRHRATAYVLLGACVVSLVGCRTVRKTLFSEFPVAEEYTGPGELRDTLGAWPDAVSMHHVRRLDSNLWHVELPRFGEFRAEQQEHADHCWAACVRACLHYKGRHAPSEEEIVLAERDGEDERGGPTDIASALGAGQCFISNGPGNLLVHDLASGNPIVVGLQEETDGPGHACVLIAADISWWGFPGQATAVFHRVFLADPATGRIERMSAPRFRRQLDFAVSYRAAGRAGQPSAVDVDEADDREADDEDPPTRRPRPGAKSSRRRELR